MFSAGVEAFRMCPKCDEEGAGIWERRGCRCVWDVEVGTYPTQSAARLAAMAKARRKGTTLQGRMNGNYTIETTDGIIEAGSIKP